MVHLFARFKMTVDLYMLPGIWMFCCNYCRNWSNSQPVYHVSHNRYCFCHVQHTAWVWKNYYCYSNTSSFWWTFILSFHSWCLFLAVVVASKLISIFVPQARNSSFKFPRLGAAILISSKDKLLGLVLFF